MPGAGHIRHGLSSGFGRIPTVPFKSARVEFGACGAQVSGRLGFSVSGGSGGGLGAVRRALGLFSPGAEIDDIAHGVLAAGIRAAVWSDWGRICRGSARFGGGGEITDSSP